VHKRAAAAVERNVPTICKLQGIASAKLQFAEAVCAKSLCPNYLQIRAPSDKACFRADAASIKEFE
jgi:hypothetical protein